MNDDNNSPKPSYHDLAADPAAAAAAAVAVEPFRGVQGMGPMVIESLLQFGRAESNREVVDALACEVRFVRPVRRRSKKNSRPKRVASPARTGVDGELAGTEGVEVGAWVEGKTVVFTGSLTRCVLDFFFVLRSALLCSAPLPRRTMY